MCKNSTLISRVGIPVAGFSVLALSLTLPHYYSSIHPSDCVLLFLHSIPHPTLLLVSRSTFIPFSITSTSHSLPFLASTLTRSY
ncbi:hypothetical protein BDW59DRAFT_30809 [Aspergillus cavernicola]|uniref:Secreted protein n=1 Tax=Aspergillus cavernicola TaxID=176166 RepID=A0ABR4HDM0_9EURO